MAARRAAADGRTANHRWEDIMTARQEWMALRMHGHLALGAAALLAVAAVPSIAQAPGGIPGVLAPSAVPDLVQEGFVFTEGPLGTADGVSISPTSGSAEFSISIPPARSRWCAKTLTGRTASHLPGTVNSCSPKVTASASPSATRTAPSPPLPKARLACRFLRPTTCWWILRAASISPTPVRDRWWRADRPTCTTSHLARGSRSCSTAASRDLTG